MYKKIFNLFVVAMVMLCLTGCGEKSKLQEVITRSEDAIKQLQKDEITIDELAKKLKNIYNYCETYEDTDKSYGTSLCSTILLYEYDASMNAVSNDGIDYKYWDKALEELEEFKDKIN